MHCDGFKILDGNTNPHLILNLESIEIKLINRDGSV